MALTNRIVDKLYSVGALAQAGLLAPVRPDRLIGIARAVIRYGATPGAALAAAAARNPDATALVHELGELSYGELDARSDALARALHHRGIAAGDGVAILCRNHRWFIEATAACSKLGANCLYLNTMFSGPQIADVMEREGAEALIYDCEFSELVAAGGEGRKRFVAWHGEGDQPSHETIEQLVAEAPSQAPPRPAEHGRIVILTSGTTGTPKGAQRDSSSSIDPAAAILSKIPLRARETTMIAAPLFHSWGFAHLLLGMALQSKLVLRRKFDPEQTIAAVAEHRATGLAVVPVMLQRIVELPPETFERHDTSALRVIAVSGSALPGPLATRVMDLLGDVLYNLYGSTEVAYATIATPEDMRAAPGTAGRPPRGTIVKLLDEEDREVAPGESGRIFVGNGMLFEGYTDGNDKVRIGDLMSTGDVGHFDEDGRLFVDGRDDDMIVSGGENVFPSEVEDLLAHHEAVREAAVIGVDDEQYGQRLKAFVALNNAGAVDEAELKGYVKSNLAGYKVPREIEFVDELPRNATGKVLKRELE
jgi:fatty-acyl-CoA synthase